MVQLEDGEFIDAWLPADGPALEIVQRQLGGGGVANSCPRGPPPRPSPPPRPPPPRAATFHSSAPAPPSRPQRWLHSGSVPRPTRSPIQAALAASAPPPTPRRFTDSPRPPPRPPSPAHAGADDHGAGVDRAAKAPRWGARVRVPGTALYCMAPDCQRKREAADCQWCVWHCQWEGCRVHWDRPGRCQHPGCQHQAPRVRPGESRLECHWRCCRQHCPHPDRCEYHKEPPRPSTNRTRGVRSAAGI